MASYKVSLNNPLAVFFHVNKPIPVDLLILRGLDEDDLNLKMETESLLRLIAKNSNIIATIDTKYPIANESVFS